MNLYELVGNLAYDMKNIPLNQEQLQEVCHKEAKSFHMPTQELVRKVEAAYASKFIYS